MIRFTRTNEKGIDLINVEMTMDKGLTLGIGLMSYGAGIRYIKCSRDSVTTMLTLSYKDLTNATTNPSLSGLTVGPNAGRIKGSIPLTFADSSDSFTTILPVNDGANQIHGGRNNLSSVNWKTSSVRLDPSASQLTVVFRTSLSDGTEGWPGNRTFQVKYLISDSGTLSINMETVTDKTTFINMTNHLYWMRDGLDLSIPTSRMVINHPDHLPDKVVDMMSGGATGVATTTVPDNSTAMAPDRAGLFNIKKEAILNNGFFVDDYSDTGIGHNNDPACGENVCDGSHTAALLAYKDLGLNISLRTDAGLVIVYTGDYLDDSSVLMDNSVSCPACAVALEPQELYPLSSYSLCRPQAPFKRTILYTFSV